MNIARFLQRSWPGFTSWLVTVLACVAVFECLTILAWRNQDGRFIDVTTALVAIPAGCMLLLVLAALIWSFFGKAPFLAGLGWTARLLPFAWAIPLFDLIRTYGNGLVIGPPKLSGLGLVYSSFTAGLFPIESGISIGMRLGLFAAAVGTGIVTWTLSGKLWKAIAGGVIMSAVSVKILSVMSLLALWRYPFSAEGWTALPFEISRRATLTLSGGYWWNRLYERFPAAIDGQTDVALRLVESAFVLCSLGLVLIVAFLLLVNKRWSILKHIYRSWSTFDLALYTIIGIAVARSQDVPASSGGATCVLAASLFLLLLLALRFSMVLRRDLSRLETDERNRVHQPILQGELTADNAKAMAFAGELFVLFASWTLGWPVFASALVCLSASRLTRDRAWSGNAYAATIFRALGAGAIALLALFFMMRSANVTTAALIALVIAALHRMFIELFWLKRVGK